MEYIRVEKASRGIWYIVMARPQLHNAFNDEMISELLDAIDQCQSDTSCRVVVLKSDGKNFSAGADLNWMKRMATLDYEDNRKDAARLASLMHNLFSLEKPVIARIQGAAYGGALGLIAASDIAIAGTDAGFCLSETKIGLVPAVISPYVIRAMGERMANRYFLTAERFNAEQALAMQLVHQVVAPETLDETVSDITENLLKNGPGAMTCAKQLVHRLGAIDISNDIINYTSELIAQVRVSQEGQAGLSAFLNKEQPNWIHH